MSFYQQTVLPDLIQDNGRRTNPFNITVDERSRVANLLDILYPRFAESKVTHVLPVFLLRDQSVSGAFRSGAVAQKVIQTRLSCRSVNNDDGLSAAGISAAAF
ncbi:MAG: hypothetical protein L6R38_008089 [Xanthoria sp. 2 TBL-2021]|nr:MAG: hypothetical protein L6R38_008089 [Xanthoria sp. 2 TBL-2021]